MVLLDTRNRVIAIRTVYRGSLNSAAVRVGEVFKDAIRMNAAAILVCHNHPVELCQAARADRQRPQAVQACPGRAHPAQAGAARPQVACPHGGDP